MANPEVFHFRDPQAEANWLTISSLTHGPTNRPESGELCSWWWMSSIRRMAVIPLFGLTNFALTKMNLGGGFKYFIFSPRFLGRWSNLTFADFSNGLVQPPTRNWLMACAFSQWMSCHAGRCYVSAGRPTTQGSGVLGSCVCCCLLNPIC